MQYYVLGQQVGELASSIEHHKFRCKACTIEERQKRKDHPFSAAGSKVGQNEKNGYRLPVA